MSDDRTMMVRSPYSLAGELVCEAGTAAGQRFPLSAGTVTIGRDAGCDVSLAQEPGVSRLHARVVASGDHYEVHDNQSLNGTLVNGVPVQVAPLAAGDELRICGCTLRLLVGEGPGEARIKASPARLPVPPRTAAPTARPQVAQPASRPAPARPAQPAEAARPASARGSLPPPAPIEAEDEDAFGTVVRPKSPISKAPAAPRGTGRLLLRGIVAVAGVLVIGVLLREMLGEPAPVRGPVPIAAPAGDGSPAAGRAPPPVAPSPAPTAAAAEGGAAAAPGPTAPEPGLALLPLPAADGPAPVATAALAPAAEPEPPWHDARPVAAEGVAVLAGSAGRVRAIPAKVGERVAAGATLIQLQSLGATREIETLKISIRSLQEIVESQDSDKARQMLAEERARLARIQAESTIGVTAPSAGVVAAIDVKIGAAVKPAQPVARLGGAAAAPEVEIVLSPGERAAPGAAAELRDAAGAVTASKVTRLLGEAEGGLRIAIDAAGLEPARVAGARLRTSR